MRYPPTSARRYGFAILPSSAPFPPAAISLGVSHPPETRKTFARSDFPPFHHSIIPHRAQSLLRLLCAVLLLCGAARAWAEPEIFELRTTAPFTSQEVTLTEAGVNATLGTFSFAQALNETSQLWDGYASLTNIAIDPDSGEEQWTLTANGWSATVEAAAMAAAHEGDHVLWLEFNVPVGSAPPSRSFLIPADRAGHALGLVQTDAAGASPVITALSVEAADVVLSANGGPDFTCRRASALVDLAKPFWVVDFTAGSRTPAGATFLRDGWEADAASYRIASVSFILDAVSAGENYTLHWQFPEQAEVLQSLTAATWGGGLVQLGDWSPEDETGTVCVTGSVALGANYWLTRDSDAWNCGSRNLDPFAARPSPLLWSLRGAAAPPVPWQAVTLYIATGYGSAATVVQPDGTRSVSPTTTGTLTLTDYDLWGNPHDFSYEEYTAQIDPRESFWLTANGTQCSQGETWFTNGWSAIGGGARVLETLTFGIASGGGWMQSVEHSAGSAALTLSTANLVIQDYNADGTPNFFSYDLWNATVDTSRPWFLIVNGIYMAAYEPWFYNGWQRQNGGLPDWQTVSFTIASGWGPFATVTQASGSWGLNSTGYSAFIEDYVNDNTGTLNFFYYDLYEALVDINRPFTLSVGGVALAPGATTFYAGWASQGGARPNNFNLSLSLNGDRATHDFTLTAPDGTWWPWNPTGTMHTQTATFTDPWSLDPITQLPGVDWTLDYSVLPASWSTTFAATNGNWTLTDTTTGDSQTFNPSTTAAYWLDASAWWLPSQSSDSLNISLSRWSHAFTIRQRDGGEYSVEKHSSQGSTSFTSGDTWYQSYYYFDATGHRRLISGMDWWLHDATTGEDAPVNATGLIDWHFTPKPVNLAAVQSGITAVDLSWELPATTGTELLGGTFIIGATALSAASLLTPDTSGTLHFRYTDTGVPPGVSTYTVRYSYGAQQSEAAQVGVTVLDAAALAMRDSDQDGFSDLEEFQSGTNPYDATSVPPPRIVAVSAVGSAVTGGKSLVLTLQSENGIGEVSYAIDSIDPVEHPLGTVTSITGSQVTFKSKAVPGGLCTVHFTASDTRPTAGASASGTVQIIVVANPLTVDDAGGLVEEEDPQPVPITVKVHGGDFTDKANYSYRVKTKLVHGKVSGFVTMFDPETVAGSAYCTYSPDIPFKVGESFEIEVTDTAGTKVVSTVTIAVIPFIPSYPPSVSVSGYSPAKASDVGSPVSGEFVPIRPNDDNDDGVATVPGQPAHKDNDDLVISAADDDIVKVSLGFFRGTETIRAASGTITVTLPSSGFHIFTSASGGSGSLLSGVHTLDIEDPTGPLAGLMSVGVTLYVESVAGAAGPQSGKITITSDLVLDDESTASPTAEVTLLPVEILIPEIVRKTDGNGRSYWQRTGERIPTNKLAIATLESSFKDSQDRPFKDDWIKADDDRFYIRVTDPSHSGKGPYRVRVWTNTPGTNGYDDDDRTSSAFSQIVELSETGNTGVFTSESMLLNSNDGDDVQVAFTKRRTFKIGLWGKLKVELLEHKATATYNADIEAEVPVEKTVKIKVFVAIVNGTQVTSDADIDADLKVLQETMAQAGVKIVRSDPVVKFNHTDAGINLADGLTVDVPDVQEAASLFNWVHAQRAADEISYIYINRMDSPESGGLAFREADFPTAPNYVGHIIMEQRERKRYIVAHEMLHILLNAHHKTNLLTGDLILPGYSIEEWNHIRMTWRNKSSEAGIDGSKRISKYTRAMQKDTIIANQQYAK